MQKPRIQFSNGWWYCGVDKGAVGYGIDPFEAYADWTLLINRQEYEKMFYLENCRPSALARIFTWLSASKL